MILAGVFMLAPAALLLWMFHEARRDPIVRRAGVAMPGWPAGAPPVRVVLMSDTHAGTMAVDPARLTRIVAQVNALRPDLILLAGDFLPGHTPIGEAQAIDALAPLAALHAPLGVLAVPGNHDHWTGSKRSVPHWCMTAYRCSSTRRSCADRGRSARSMTISRATTMCPWSSTLYASSPERG